MTTYVLAYRIVVFVAGSALILLAGLLACAVWSAPMAVPSRRRSTSRYATVCHAIVTIAVCIVSIVAASRGTMEEHFKRQWFQMQLALCVGTSQGIDACVGMSAWIYIFFTQHVSRQGKHTLTSSFTTHTRS